MKKLLKKSSLKVQTIEGYNGCSACGCSCTGCPVAPTEASATNYYSNRTTGYNTNVFYGF